MKKSFYIQATDILKEYNFKPCNYLSYTMQKQTEYGLLYVRVDSDTMKNKLFSIYMMFDNDNFNKYEFMRAFLTDNFNHHSYKWNIHTRNSDIAIQTLENRLEGLTYPIAI
jgi:hypothetical protein